MIVAITLVAPTGSDLVAFGFPLEVEVASAELPAQHRHGRQLPSERVLGGYQDRELRTSLSREILMIKRLSATVKVATRTAAANQDPVRVMAGEVPTSEEP